MGGTGESGNDRPRFSVLSELVVVDGDVPDQGPRLTRYDPAGEGTNTRRPVLDLAHGIGGKRFSSLFIAEFTLGRLRRLTPRDLASRVG